MISQYPPTFEERNLAGDVHIEPEDIADYAQQPGKRKRYTDAGWLKARQIGIADLLYPEDFGAVSDSAKAGDV